MDSLLSSIAEYSLAAFTFIIIFSLLIVLHECGHFWAARAAKIKILEFGFGLPPKIWAKKTTKVVEYEDKDGKKYKEDTPMEWTLNAIPFGGFVRMLGEDEKSTDPGAFGQRPLLWRMIVVAGGVIMNFILGWALFTIAFTIGLNPMMPSAEQRELYTSQGIFEKQNLPVFDNIEGTIFEEIGIEKYDKIISLNEKPIDSAASFIDRYNFEKEMNKSEIPLTIERFVLSDRKFESHTFSFPLNKNPEELLEKTFIEITEIIPNSPSDLARLHQGDRIISLEGVDLDEAEQFISSVKYQNSLGKEIVRVGVERDGNPHVFIINLNKDGQIGARISNTIEITTSTKKATLTAQELFYPIKPVQYPWYEAPKVALEECGLWMDRTWGMIKNLVTKVTTELELPEEAGGPIAIADTTHTLTQFGDFSKILQFAAILSLSLAIVNMMPFPGLDGGRFIFLIAEGILTGLAVILSFFGIKKFPKKIPDSWEIPFHLIGYGLLLILIVWISFNDVVRIFFS